ncbi:unnamed protein product [Camellia sinensis]
MIVMSPIILTSPKVFKSNVKKKPHLLLVQPMYYRSHMHPYTCFAYTEHKSHLHQTKFHSNGDWEFWDHNEENVGEGCGD